MPLKHGAGNLRAGVRGAIVFQQPYIWTELVWMINNWFDPFSISVVQ